MHICLKKLHLGFFSVSICSASPASNSLQIFQLIPCKSLWDLTCLVSWGDKCFLCDELDLTGLFPLVQPNSFGATEAHNSVPPISLQEKQLATCSCIPFDPSPLNDSCPLPASHSTCCFVLWLKDQTHSWQKSRRTLLGNWCQRGRERSHQSLIISIGRGIIRKGVRPRCLVFKRR